MAQLPVKICEGLRDHWEETNPPVKESISALSGVIGLPVDVTLEAPMLWRELEKYFPDLEDFVPSVVGVIKSWMECMTSRLEDAANTAWTERLLETCGRRLKVQVETQSGSRATTWWEYTNSLFIISIPESPPPYSSVFFSFMTDLEDLFNTTSTKNVLARSQGVDDEGWADIDIPSNRRGQPRQNSPITSQTLPQLDSLAQPDTLFLHKVPYHMAVKMTSKGIVVQGSHYPSLELLVSYFLKWTRTLKNGTKKVRDSTAFPHIPILKFELQESHFGLDMIFDSVTIKAADERQTWVVMNPILVVAFIEGVLGYQSVPECRNGDDWYFKRDEQFL